MTARRAILFVLILALPAQAGAAAKDTPVREARIKEIATIEGVRANPLIGYGIVVGLNGTGDRRQTVFTTQTLASVLQRMGVQIPTASVRVNNVAAVFVTASLPPFARPGTRIDVTISSTGDAKSLEGGLLLLTPLYGADGQVYAAAQGPLTVGGYAAGLGANSRTVNHPTVGRIPEGASVERDTSLDLRQLKRLSFLLREPDFSSARNIANAINRELGKDLASVIDSRRVEINADSLEAGSVPALLARVENLFVAFQSPSKVVVNERTGTVVMGRDVSLGACSILHGTLSIEITTDFQVSQPAPLSPQGQTMVVPQTTLQTKETPARRVELSQGATVEDLVRGLQAIGATARDIVAILQALKAAGALQAELEVI
ncbi:MAG: flagellar basal body P-ring protein FlgI [Acidobacteria bacterium]|nr:flagellar basal body P-ring protein FlgI [Acidobacteriota bacterium]MBI3662986.1 flagellar basal body P-ring protein FlgI [Acidobacteriota bacterium]